MAKNVMTYKGLRELEEELEDLKVNWRRDIAEKIKEAREQGDLSENAEYDAAKNEQRDMEARITELEEILKNAEVFSEEDIESGVVNIGSTFTLLDLEYDEELVYELGGETEANSLGGKISNESPIGKAIIGAKEGDVVEIDAPVGKLKYKVIKIHNKEKNSGTGKSGS
ncbi:MAG: transcription elongation factor GreA [Catonella sp.]|uniref:transcription elongation factor GreA n=1 Tax=Catonella sp. TaxID=2382125 RepID=UPI003F9FB8FF